MPAPSPLAEAVRLLALRHAIDATGTLARIDELAARDLLGRDEEDDLRAAFDHITRLQLRQQIADFRAGRPVGNFVAPTSLTRGEIHLLERSFQAINRFRSRLRWKSPARSCRGFAGQRRESTERRFGAA